MLRLARLNWLRARELEQPAFTHHYLHDGVRTTREVVRQLADGQLVAVTDGPEAVARISETVARLNEIEPHYRFSVTAGPHGEIVSMEPAYPGAETDRPATLRLEAAFPDTAEGRAARGAWEQFLDFGDPVKLTGDHLTRVVLDLPAGFGIHDEPPHPPALIRLRSSRVPIHSIPARAVIQGENGRRLASLTVDLQVGHRGRRGAVATGTNHFRRGARGPFVTVPGPVRRGAQGPFLGGYPPTKHGGQAPRAARASRVRICRVTGSASVRSPGV